MSSEASAPAPVASGGWGARRLAHLLLLLAGLAVAVFGLVRIADPHATCRGVTMQPGDLCHKNGYSQMGTEQVQSYEERLHAARLSQPVVVGTGLAVAGFGAVLLRQEMRRRPDQD